MRGRGRESKRRSGVVWGRNKCFTAWYKLFGGEGLVRLRSLMGPSTLLCSHSNSTSTTTTVTSTRISKQARKLWPEAPLFPKQEKPTEKPTDKAYVGAEDNTAKCMCVEWELRASLCDLRQNPPLSGPLFPWLYNEGLV